MCKVFAHCPVAHGKRLFPYRVPRNVIPMLALMQSDDVAGEVNKAVAAAVTGRHICAVNRRHAPRSRESKEFAHRERVVLKELLVIVTVR